MSSLSTKEIFSLSSLSRESFMTPFSFYEVCL